MHVIVFLASLETSVRQTSTIVAPTPAYEVAVSMASTTSRVFVTQAMWERHATLITMTAVLLLVIMGIVATSRAPTGVLVSLATVDRIAILT